MSKETKKSVEATPAQAIAEPKGDGKVKIKREKKPRTPMNVTYVILKTEKTEAALKDLPKQAQQIANILLEAGNKGLDRATLLAKSAEAVKTVQPIQRIVDYYRKMLQELLGMTVAKAEKPAAA